MLKKFIVIQTILPSILPYILLYALYIQLNGESSPGGGFQAGVIFTTSIIAYDLVFGHKKLDRYFTIRSLTSCGTVGVLLYAVIGLISVMLGDEFLNYNSLLLNNNINSQPTGIFFIELGIGLTVFSMMYLIYKLLRQK